MIAVPGHVSSEAMKINFVAIAMFKDKVVLAGPGRQGHEIVA